MPYYISQPPMNPITRVFAAVVAVLAFVGMFFFGLIILAVVIGLGLLFWLVIRLRMWWIMRHLPAGETAPSQAPEESPGQSEIIEAEYTVVSRHRD